MNLVNFNFKGATNSITLHNFNIKIRNKCNFLFLNYK